MEDEEVAIVEDDFQCDIKSILATPQRDPSSSRTMENRYCGRKLSLEPQEGIVLFGISGTGHKPNPQGFAQSHIGKRCLLPLPYKHLA